MLSDIKGLASTIVARLSEIDAQRSMPRDVIETLRSIGIFRSLVPRRYGGLELDVPAALEIVTANAIFSEFAIAYSPSSARLFRIDN